MRVVRAALLVLIALPACAASSTNPEPPSSSSAAPSSSAISGSTTGPYASMPHTHKQRKVTRPRRPLELTSGPHDLAHAVTMNARDDDDRIIVAIGAYCAVRVPPPGPISIDHVEYEIEEVDCPASYDDPAWDDCTTTIFKEPSGCYCTPESDDPPSPPSVVDCPAAP